MRSSVSNHHIHDDRSASFSKIPVLLAHTVSEVPHLTKKVPLAELSTRYFQRDSLRLMGDREKEKGPLPANKVNATHSVPLL